MGDHARTACEDRSKGKSATLTIGRKTRTEAISMWGAVIGDIAGSRFEGSRGCPKDFELFHRRCTYTDDTVCTAAIAHIIVNDREPDSTLQRWCRRHPDRGYGGAFRQWIASPAPRPYESFGNGAAMRVSPVALLYRGRPLDDALALSGQVTEITHDHPEGMKGARAVTEAIWRALRGEGAEGVRREITNRYGYDLKRTVEDIRPSHRFDVTCQGTVPTALICALESTSLEEAVRNAVSLGGDADTLAAIAGAGARRCTDCPRGSSRPRGNGTCRTPKTSREHSMRSTSAQRASSGLKPIATKATEWDSGPGRPPSLRCA